MHRTSMIVMRRLATMRRITAIAALVLAMGAGGCSSSTSPEERVLTIEVAPSRVACMGVAPMECLQIREVSGGAEAEFSPTFIPIEGFVHETGYRYTLRVAERRLKNPPADGSSIVYRLIEVISRVRVD